MLETILFGNPDMSKLSVQNVAVQNPPAQNQTIRVNKPEISSSIPNSQEKVVGLQTFLRQFGLRLNNCVLGWTNDNGVAKESMKCKSRVKNLRELGVFTRLLDLHLKKYNSGNNPVVYENNNFQYFFTRILYMQDANGEITDLIFVLTPVSKIQLGNNPKQIQNISLNWESTKLKQSLEYQDYSAIKNLLNTSNIFLRACEAGEAKTDDGAIAQGLKCFLQKSITQGQYDSFIEAINQQIELNGSLIFDNKEINAISPEYNKKGEIVAIYFLNIPSSETMVARKSIIHKFSSQPISPNNSFENSPTARLANLRN